MEKVVERYSFKLLIASNVCRDELQEVCLPKVSGSLSFFIRDFLVSDILSITAQSMLGRKDFLNFRQFLHCLVSQCYCDYHSNPDANYNNKTTETLTVMEEKVIEGYVLDFLAQKGVPFVVIRKFLEMKGIIK
jgi:hypothetical protein